MQNDPQKEAEVLLISVLRSSPTKRLDGGTKSDRWETDEKALDRVLSVTKALERIELHDRKILEACYGRAGEIATSGETERSQRWRAIAGWTLAAKMAAMLKKTTPGRILEGCFSSRASEGEKNILRLIELEASSILSRALHSFEMEAEKLGLLQLEANLGEILALDKIDPDKAATMLGIHPSTARRMCADGALPAQKLGGKYQIDLMTLRFRNPELWDLLCEKLARRKAQEARAQVVPQALGGEA